MTPYTFSITAICADKEQVDRFYKELVDLASVHFCGVLNHVDHNQCGNWIASMRPEIADDRDDALLELPGEGPGDPETQSSDHGPTG